MTLRHPTNPLAVLFDDFCSDKGTFWQSRHHYANAYHALFTHIRRDVRQIVEIGIGEDTAPSVATWLQYFPNADIHALDIKDKHRFIERAAPFGATERLVHHQAQFGCKYDRGMWRNPRVHLTLGVDASDGAQLLAVPLPAKVDLVIDDGSHRLRDQEATLALLWDRLAPGGLYIVEDLLVGKLPWDAHHDAQVPSNNSGCGHECFFPQRPAEHPLLYDRFEQYSKNASRLTDRTREIMADNDWFWVITGVHRGGGVDASLVLRKDGLFLPQSSAWSYVWVVPAVCASLVLLLSFRPSSRHAYRLLRRQ